MSATHDHAHGHEAGGGGHDGGGGGGHDAHGHHEHIHPPSHYVKIWGVLCVLLVVSVVGPFVGDLLRSTTPTGAVVLTLVTAFGIAFVKAGMVIKYFMHLDNEKPVVWYILITALVFMVLFFAAVSPDVMNHHGSRWVNVSAEAEVQRGLAEGSGHHDGAEAPHGAPAGHEAPAEHGAGH
jgi:caa(3)-type oxidase subunit IV